jgi:hypothetical protein
VIKNKINTDNVKNKMVKTIRTALLTTLKSLKPNNGFTVESETTSTAIKGYFSLKSNRLKNISVESHFKTAMWMLNTIKDNKEQILLEVKNGMQKLIENK